MNCALSIATRTGGHFRCRLDDGHDGGCLPMIGDAVPKFRIAPVVGEPEPTFLAHLLAIMHANNAPEAIKLCASLIRQRFGQEPPF